MFAELTSRGNKYWKRGEHSSSSLLDSSC